MKTKGIDRILIPVDYSATAQRAASMGVSLAKRFGAEVFLFHSYGLPAIGISEGIVIADNIKHNEAKKLHQFMERLKNEFGDVVIHPILEFGSAVDLIQRTVEERRIDLVVMGTKGNTDAVNTVFGSIASHTIQNVPCPVLIIPKNLKTEGFKEVLFASDFHFTNDTATYLKPLLALSREFQPVIHIVHVEQFVPVTAHVRNVEELKLTGLLSETKHSFHYLEAADTEEGLFDFAHKYHCDLIVALTRHYSIWERMVHRSLTKKLALHSEIPLLILHETEDE